MSFSFLFARVKQPAKKLGFILWHICTYFMKGVIYAGNMKMGCTAQDLYMKRRPYKIWLSWNGISQSFIRHYFCHEIYEQLREDSSLRTDQSPRWSSVAYLKNELPINEHGRLWIWQPGLYITEQGYTCYHNQLLMAGESQKKMFYRVSIFSENK